jgi:tetratricopeptide (TPR) repeat protein
MAEWSGIRVAAVLVLLSFRLHVAWAQARAVPDNPLPETSALQPLDLTPAQRSQLQQAMQVHNYVAAEKVLLPEIQADPHSERAGRLLAFAGVVYFLDRDYMNAAIAWKKSEAIAPLEPQLEFSLAMAYIRMERPEWARPVLTTLAAQDSKDALYPYWLGRLDYDGREYSDAIREFQHAIALDSGMSRAYDNLGLCYYHENQNDLAVQNYQKAIALDRAANDPSAWPYLNLAVTLQLLNRAPEAEADLRQAIRIDPSLAQAHFQLGIVLERMKQAKAAIPELQTAARLDTSYAEPHIALARIYHKLGQDATAREEEQKYLRLRAHAGPKVN